MVALEGVSVLFTNVFEANWTSAHDLSVNESFEEFHGELVLHHAALKRSLYIRSVTKMPLRPVAAANNSLVVGSTALQQVRVRRQQRQATPTIGPQPKQVEVLCLHRYSTQF